eukprot:m.207412 g.207412  ORF g.207412 m.207412 type:complete len:352 (+) comp23757_c0_seq1:313-1368(+)
MPAQDTRTPHTHFISQSTESTPVGISHNVTMATVAARKGGAMGRPVGTAARVNSAVDWLASAEYAKGGVAAIVQVSITYPIQKITFRQQIHGTCVRSTIATLRNETMRHLFRGMVMPMTQRALTTSIMFGVFHDYQKRLLPVENRLGMHRVVTNGIAGMMSGFTEAVFNPLERVQALMQAPQYHDTICSSRGAFRECWRIDGLRELYRGVQPVLIRNGVSSGVYFAFREPMAESVQRLLIKESCSPLVHTAVPSFLSGAVLGALVSTAVYPLAVVKSRAHTILGGPHRSFCSLLREVVHERGSIAGLYRGCGVNVIRTLIGWGIVNVVYDLVGDLQLFFPKDHPTRTTPQP